MLNECENDIMTANVHTFCGKFRVTSKSNYLSSTTRLQNALRDAVLLLFVAIVALCIAGCKSETSNEVKNHEKSNPQNSHERMLSELQKARKLAWQEDEYFATAGVQREEKVLAATPTNDDANRFQLLWNLGIGHLRLGNNRKAIEHLESADELLPRLRFRLSEEVVELFLLDLAVAYLRLGETENCVHCQTGESCILPIRAGGVHQQPEGSRSAVKQLTRRLEQKPGDLTARWLLNLAHMTLGQYPDQVPSSQLIPPEAFRSEIEFPRFREIARQLELDSLTCSGGVIVDDFDNDGFLDIVVSSWHPAEQMQYFRNNGDGTFTERTEEAGLKGLCGGLNMNQADYDNDGDLDILVLRGAWRTETGCIPNSLLRNDGKGNFRDVTFDAGLGTVHLPTQTAAWADFDNDGDLDLYIGNEADHCQLFENQDDGTFKDVSESSGVKNERFAKGVVCGDFNGDRFPDLYVSNLGQPNRLYINNTDGTFNDRGTQLGVTRPLKSFPVWAWDYNNDGILDLYVPSYDMGVEHVAADYLGLARTDEQDCLYQGLGGGRFTEVARKCGLTRATQPMGCNFGDLNGDGFQDFYLGTGYVGYQGLMPNLMFINQGGESFADATTAAGLGHLQKGHGIAFADIDHDGDQDLFAEMGGANPGDAFNNVLFENPGFGNRFIVVKLVGTTSNRCAIGSRIRVEIEKHGTTRSVYKWVNSGGSFGANPLRQYIGLGKAERIVKLEIYWPTSDLTQQFTDVPLDSFLNIKEGEKQYQQLPYTALDLN